MGRTACAVAGMVAGSVAVIMLMGIEPADAQQEEPTVGGFGRDNGFGGGPQVYSSGEIAAMKASGEFILFSVLEGLYADNVESEIVDAIIPPLPDGKRDYSANFVYPCPLCQPAFEAFRLYSVRYDFVRLKIPPKFPTRLSQETREAILGSDPTRRREALQQMIQTWMTRRMEALNLSDDERTALVASVESGRKTGMGTLRGMRTTTQEIREDSSPAVTERWTNCAICDGAAGACQIPLEP